MDGKRFGVGLAAGILVGLAVITASGGLGAGLAEFAPAGSLNYAAVVTTTTAPGSTVTTSAPTQSTNGSTPLTASLSNSTKTAATFSTTSAPSSAVSTTPLYILANLTSLAPTIPSSRLSSVATQPFSSNAIIFIPVLVAFLLGALLFRASVSGKAESSEEPQPSEA